MIKHRNLFQVAGLYSALTIGLLSWVAMLMASGTAMAQVVTTPHVESELVPEVQSIGSGRPFRVALRLKMDEGWHTYWRNPGDAGMPTSIEWTLPEGFTAGEIEWPYPELLGEAPEVSYGYGGEIFLPVRITPPADLKPGSRIRIAAAASWLVCKEACLPGEAELSLELPVESTPPSVHEQWKQGFSIADARTPHPLTGWRNRAVQTGEGYIVHLVPPDPSAQLPGMLTFFAAEESIIDHSAPQTVTRSADGITIRLARSPYGAAPPERLRGVLYAPEGWNAGGTMKGVEVDIPVEAESDGL